VVKHFARMRMRRAKTDAADARLLADFGADQTPDPWQPPQEHLFHLQQLQATLHHYVGERTRITNQLEAFRHTGHLHPRVKASLGRLHRQVEKEIQRLEKELDGLLRAQYGDLVDRLTTIPGLGAKTSLQLMLISDGFTRFQQVKQLVAYVGLAPRLSQSGTRTQGRAPICKLGAGRIRACLYMAALSALTRNPACKALYERLRRAGKTHKMARVAVAHKLVRQAFAVATGGGGYEASRALPLTS
jgi:transposase